MRDLVVREALEAMARDAAKRLRELVASGAEIPYDVREAGDGSPLPQYTPLTERFIHEHAPLLRELDSFGSACAAIESGNLAVPYLAEAGIEAPPDGRRRAELAGVVFLCRLWEDSTDFSLDEARLRRAVAELQAKTDASEGEIEVIVPLRGLRMEATKVELATATIVRADTVDVPGEARSPDASGGAGWEPTFIAATRVPADPPDEDDLEAPDAGTRSVEAFRSLITALRLFKEGGVALGPHAWTRLGSGRWRRVATGAGKPRPGGYFLTESELPALAAFSRALAQRSTPFGPPAPGRTALAGALGRAIARFESGLERVAPMDALNDYLLALRFVLEGGGPAQLGLSMRVAALCAEPDARSEVKAVMDRALALERELWSGEPAASGDHTPSGIAASVEDLARAILKDAACGHLGAELRVTADEILLADGLAVGDGAADQRGATAEWQDAEPGPEALETEAPEAPPEAPPASVPMRDFWGEEPGRDETRELWLDGLDDADPADEVQVVSQPGRIRVEHAATPSADDASDQDEIEEDRVIARAQQHAFAEHDEDINDERPTTAMPALEYAEAEHARRAAHASGEESPVVRLLAIHAAEREETRARVANLFPRPETTEWSVREIGYDRTRRANVEAS